MFREALRELSQLNLPHGTLQSLNDVILDLRVLCLSTFLQEATEGKQTSRVLCSHFLLHQYLYYSLFTMGIYLVSCYTIITCVFMCFWNLKWYFGADFVCLIQMLKHWSRKKRGKLAIKELLTWYEMFCCFTFVRPQLCCSIENIWLLDKGS